MSESCRSTISALSSSPLSGSSSRAPAPVVAINPEPPLRGLHVINAGLPPVRSRESALHVEACLAYRRHVEGGRHVRSSHLDLSLAHFLVAHGVGDRLRPSRRLLEHPSPFEAESSVARASIERLRHRTHPAVR